MEDDAQSLVSVVDEIDSFPYFEKGPEEYRCFLSPFYYLIVEGYEEPFAYVRQDIVSKMPWPAAFWSLDDEKRTLTLLGQDLETRTARVQRTLRLGWETHSVPYPRGWTNELIPVKTFEGEVVFSMDESGADLFGIVCQAVCLTAWTTTETGKVYWIQRRSQSRRTFPGFFDNTAMGALRAYEDPLEGVVRETLEEAGLPEDLVRSNIQNCGTVSYHLTKMHDGTLGSLPHVQYVFEIELPNDVIPIPTDGEVEEFVQMSASQVQQALLARKFKPNMAAVWVDHFCRNGHLNPANEPNFDELRFRVHREHRLFRL